MRAGAGPEWALAVRGGLGSAYAMHVCSIGTGGIVTWALTAYGKMFHSGAVSGFRNALGFRDARSVVPVI